MTAHSILRTETFEWHGPAGGPRLDTGMSGLAYLTGIRDGVISAPPLDVLASAELVEIQRGRVELICSVADPQFGLLRELDPGMASLLVTTAIGCVAQTLVELGQGWATTSSKTSYVRPASRQSGVLIATAQAVAETENHVLITGKVRDATGQLVIRASTSIELFDVDASGATVNPVDRS
jgi:acyl-coenzyme A thioesterase PaaI-like protein